MFALGTSLNTFKASLNRKVNGLIIANFKMKKRVIFNTPPIPPVKRVFADKIYGSCNVTVLPFGEDQESLFGH